MTTKYDKAFSSISFDGLNTAEKLGYLTHDQAQEMRTIISNYLSYLEAEDERLADDLTPEQKREMLEDHVSQDLEQEEQL